MSVRLIERRIEALEAERSADVILLWAEPGGDAQERIRAAREDDPWATVLVLTWQA